MAYECRIEKDSINVYGNRLTTMVVRFPRIILAEFNTHRMFSRNSASSRAIPVRKVLQNLVFDSFIPAEFGTAKAGMNAGPILTGAELEEAIAIWGNAREAMIGNALCLLTSTQVYTEELEKWQALRGESVESFHTFVLALASRVGDKNDSLHQNPLLNVSKGLTNRLLEPFVWHEAVVTFTDVDNFFNLRTDENAQLEIRTIAQMMREVYLSSQPVEVHEGEWHLPFIQPDEEEWVLSNPKEAALASAARCARVSYKPFEADSVDLEKDLQLARSLARSRHMSPFEHVATPFSEEEHSLRKSLIQDVKARGKEAKLAPFVTRSLIHQLQYAGNFCGWSQLRREMTNEAVFSLS